MHKHRPGYLLTKLAIIARLGLEHRKRLSRLTLFKNLQHLILYILSYVADFAVTPTHI
jgi:hypothetical protein